MPNFMPMETVTKEVRSFCSSYLGVLSRNLNYRKYGFTSTNLNHLINLICYITLLTTTEEWGGARVRKKLVVWAVWPVLIALSAANVIKYEGETIENHCLRLW